MLNLITSFQLYNFYNVRWEVMKDGLGRMWVVIMANFMVISWYLSERTGENMTKIWPRWLAFYVWIGLGTSWHEARCNVDSTGKVILPDIPVGISSFNNSSDQADWKSLICYLVRLVPRFVHANESTLKLAMTSLPAYNHTDTSTLHSLRIWYRSVK